MSEMLAIEETSMANATGEEIEHQVEQQRFLTFVLNSEIFALNIQSISEIIEYSQVTRIPMAPHCIRGLFNLRGHVLPLVDLAARMGLDSSEMGKRTSIIVLTLQQQDQSISLGVVVDAIDQVLQVATDKIEPRPEFGMGIDARFVNGMAKINDDFVALINIDSVLSVEEIGGLIGEFSRNTYSEFCQQAKGMA